MGKILHKLGRMAQGTWNIEVTNTFGLFSNAPFQKDALSYMAEFL